MQITEHLASLHKAIESLLKTLAAEAATSDLRSAAVTFEALDAALTRNIRAEEKILFPLFESVTGASQGPTAALRFEHWELMKTLHVVRVALERSDPNRLEQGVHLLGSIVPSHHQRETCALYLLDSFLSEPQQMEVVRQLKA